MYAKQSEPKLERGRATNPPQRNPRLSRSLPGMAILGFKLSLTIQSQQKKCWQAMGKVQNNL